MAIAGPKALSCSIPAFCSSDPALTPEQLNSRFVSSHAQMPSDVGHDPAERTNSEDTMAWNGQAMRHSADGCGQRHVAAPLPDEAIAEVTPEQRSQVFA